MSQHQKQRLAQHRNPRPIGAEPNSTGPIASTLTEAEQRLVDKYLEERESERVLERAIDEGFVVARLREQHSAAFDNDELRRRIRRHPLFQQMLATVNQWRQQLSSESKEKIAEVLAGGRLYEDSTIPEEHDFIKLRQTDLDRLRIEGLPKKYIARMRRLSLTPKDVRRFSRIDIMLQKKFQRKSRGFIKQLQQFRDSVASMGPQFRYVVQACDRLFEIVQRQTRINASPRQANLRDFSLPTATRILAPTLVSVIQTERKLAGKTLRGRSREEICAELLEQAGFGRVAPESIAKAVQRARRATRAR